MLEEWLFKHAYRSVAIKLLPLTWLFGRAQYLVTKLFGKSFCFIIIHVQKCLKQSAKISLIFLFYWKPFLNSSNIVQIDYLHISLNCHQMCFIVILSGQKSVMTKNHYINIIQIPSYIPSYVYNHMHIVSKSIHGNTVGIISCLERSCSIGYINGE